MPNSPLRFDLYEGPDSAAPKPEPKPTAKPAPETHRIIDGQMGGGLVAAVFSYPKGYQAQSQLVWDMQKISHPLRIFANVTDLSTGNNVIFFPVEAFYWLEPNWGFGRPGQEDSGIVLMKPMSAADTILRWIIPRYRNQGVTGLRILQVTPLDTRRMLPPGYKKPAGVTQEAVSVRIEYVSNGRHIEEEFCGLKTTQPGIPTYGGAGTIVQYNWGLERLFSILCDKGKLDGFRETAWSIFNSVRINPHWELFYGQVMQQIAQQFNQQMQMGYDMIAAAVRNSHRISENSDAWLAQQRHQREANYAADQHRRHEAAQSGGSYTTSDAFGDMMMGRDTYDDPYYQYGSQHGYHDEVWTDGQGNYEYRDNGGADPNVGSDRTWTLMNKREVNG